MATYGAGLKIDSKVSGKLTASGTLYTVPAGKYAIINWVINPTNSSGAASIELDGTSFIRFAPTAGDTYLSSLGANQGGNTASGGSGVMHLGPGTVLSTTITSNCNVAFDGVLLSS
jgi:hypothetical protein